MDNPNGWTALEGIDPGASMLSQPVSLTKCNATASPTASVGALHRYAPREQSRTRGAAPGPFKYMLRHSGDQARGSALEDALPSTAESQRANVAGARQAAAVATILGSHGPTAVQSSPSVTK